MDMQSLRRILEAKQLKPLQKITTLSPWIEGSLVSTSRFCGKKNCACHRGGSKHPVLYVTWKEKGKSSHDNALPRIWVAISVESICAEEPER